MKILFNFRYKIILFVLGFIIFSFFVYAYVTEMFQNHKPMYFFCDCPAQSDLEGYLIDYQVMKKDDKNTRLYVLKGKIEMLDSTQKKQLEFLNYQVSQL